MTDEEALPTVGYQTEFEREHLDSKGVVVNKTPPRNPKSKDSVDELVRREDVEALIKEKIEHLAAFGTQPDSQSFVSEDEESGYEAALSDLLNEVQSTE